MNTAKNGAFENDVAVYMDYENLYVSLKSTVKMEPDFDVIMEKCREFGRVTTARAYADWSEFSRVLTSQMFANGFEPVYVPTRKFYDAKTRGEARKNSVDIHITIDIIKSLFLHENIDVVIIISGDRDYVPLINQIRQAGKKVYALGVAGCTSSELSVAVDEMFFYHQLLESGVEEAPPPEGDIYEQLVGAVRTARRRGYPTTLGILKPIMREQVEGFNERNYKNPHGQAFQKFKDLVLEGQRRRLVRLVTVGSANEVYLYAEEAPPAQTQVPLMNAEKLRDRSRDRRPPRPPRPYGDAERPGERSTGEVPLPSLGGMVEAHEEVEAEAREAMPREPLSAPLPVTARAPTAEPPAAAPPASVAAPLRAEAPERPASVAAEPRLLTQGLLNETSWQAVVRGVDSFADRAPSPRKLMAQLRKMRDLQEVAGFKPSDDEITVLLRECVDEGRLEKISRGFNTILRLRD